MLLVESCVAFRHNLWLVAAAAGVWVLGSWALLGLLHRANEASGKQRLGWLVVAATSSGASIWCTHFVAILAYDPDVPISFDPFLTIASALLASLGAGLAFSMALSGNAAWRSWLAGAMFGVAISAMHYTGMLAYRVEGLVAWNAPTLVASIALSTLFGAAALHHAKQNGFKTQRMISVALMVAAIVGLHFTGMAALRITPLLLDLATTNHDAIDALALAIVGMTLLIVGTGFVTYLIDQDERADAFRRISDMALHDGLTTLPNRTYFRERLPRLIEDATQAHAKVALVAIDLNGFKEVNDQFGHAAGDAVLKRVALRLRNALLPNEFGARLGGDEFAVAQIALDDDSIADLVKRLSAVFAETVQSEDYMGKVGASIGVAIYPQDAGDVETLVNNADLAMYRAKADRDERVCYYERSMDERVRGLRRMASELRAALAHGELQVHYQPQTSVEGGDIKGFEALARWPRGNAYVPPAEFVPVAEEFGLIDALGQWVLMTACVEAATWEQPYKVAVNLSPLQLKRANLPQMIAAALRESGLAPSRLELELTESAIIADSKMSLRAMRQIRDLGVSLALDDFGTGYSSLSTLRNFPFDKIKLDRSFLGEIETSSEAKAVLRAVLALGEGLGIPVLTEGVETQGQLDMLRDEGCDQAQGFLLGRPASMSALVASGLLSVKAVKPFSAAA